MMKTTLTYLYLTTLFLISPYSVADNIIIEIEEARINATDNINSDSVAYMHIVNFSEDQSIELTEVNSDVAGELEILSPSDKKTSIHIGSGEAVNLEPDGYKILLKKLTSPINKGQKIVLQLTFAHGETYIVDATAVEPGTHLHEDASGNDIQHKDH